MNILLEIADRDIILGALIFLILIIIGVLVFYIVNKSNTVEQVSKKDLSDDTELNDLETKEKVQLTEEQQKAKDELERVFNQMSADLENKNPEPEEIENFEREQEENAIISYQELIRQATKQKEPINTIVPKEKEKVQLQMSIEDKEEPKKFKNSEIISPIFGVQNPNHVTSKIENKKEEPILASHAYEEIKKNYNGENNKDFLNSLKEFRKNL